MNHILEKIDAKIYKPCQLKLSKFIVEPESTAYFACSFYLNDKKIISRNAKITPKKMGQFVTLWQRNKMGETTPFKEDASFNFCIINVTRDNQIGQFVFPKTVLIEKGILSSYKKEGKRGFRVYPVWSKTVNKQAVKTQKWQLDYFYLLKKDVDVELIRGLYTN